MKVKLISLLTLIFALAYSSSWAQEPTYKQGVNIFIETGVTQPDSIPTWYAPMVAMPYAPAFEILATRKRGQKKKGSGPLMAHLIQRTEQD